MLKKIKSKSIISHETSLVLDDYDWMNYKLKASLTMEDASVLNIRFEYYGATGSIMVVNKIKNDTSKRFMYHYLTDDFRKYIIRYMTKHINSWGNNIAFDGLDIIIDFYNDVVKNGEYISDHSW